MVNIPGLDEVPGSAAHCCRHYAIGVGHMHCPQPPGDATDRAMDVPQYLQKCVCVCGGGGLSAVTAGIPTVPQMNSVGACVSVSLDCPLTAVRVWYGSVQHLEYLTDRPSGDLNPNRLHSKTSAKQVCLGVEGLEYRPRLSGGLNPNPSTPRQTQQTHLLFAEVPRVHWIQYLPIVVCARIDGVSKQRPPD